MNREQVKQLFQLIGSVYPTFLPDDQDKLISKVDTWTHLMKDMYFKRVMVKAEKHVQSNKFPPTIAEISAIAPPKNETLEKMKQWEREAEQVPDEVKQNFAKQLEHLIKDKKK